ncbi:MAG: TMEM165/GDT1 family protein [Clostridiales bacterium]|nr:TMEM165/GDT1 family protein [Clostridiales bacterium]
MNLKLFFLSFWLLFIAELGDKTQLAVFTLVTQYKQPWPIFLGSSLGLISVTLLGTFLGQFVCKYIPATILKLAAGVMFIIMGFFILKECWGEL